MDSKKVNKTYSPIEKKKEGWKLPLKWYDWVCIGFLIIGVAFFMVHRNYDLSKEIASDVWGQLGDFIGGILGTFIAYVGIRLLVETLNAQRDANDTASDSLEENKKVYVLQQFDGNFNTLLKLYEETIESYTKDNTKRGREALHDIVLNLQNEVKPSGNNYAEKVALAAEGFNQKFYIPNREVASVHFRTLYQLFQLIRESEIEEKKKVLYAKMLRGRMSEDELLLLRYNCHCSYGKKMQTNINRFNLLKHLPILSLMEFTSWREKFKGEGYINCLDTEFITLKKRIKDILISSEISDDKTNLSDKYTIILRTDTSKKKLNVELVEDTKEENKKPIDSVFKECTLDQLTHLLIDFLYETFVSSNFGVFNTFENLQINHSHESTDDGLNKIKLTINNTNSLVLAMNVRQYDDPV